jgi:hypothetical protein
VRLYRRSQLWAFLCDCNLSVEVECLDEAKLREDFFGMEKLEFQTEDIRTSLKNIEKY